MKTLKELTLRDTIIATPLLVAIAFTAVKLVEYVIAHQEMLIHSLVSR
jgi:hypothetical protein